MTLFSEDAAYEFDQLPIKHKMGFFWKNLGLDSVVYMPEWENPQTRGMFGYFLQI